jgi:hypothetical protein
MVPKFSPKMAQIIRCVDTSKRLEKIAADFRDDQEVFEKASAAKILVDAEVFDIIKQADVKSELAARLGRRALKGLGYGAGLALPMTAGGTYLLHRAGEESQETAADIRNKVLQTALGLGGIGAGLYGLHRLTGGGPLLANEKRASAPQEEVVTELVEKLATVGVIDDMLDNIGNDVSEETQKLAAEIRILNRGYGVQLLYEAAHG